MVAFRVDTGADRTCLHPGDGSDLGIPFADLRGEIATSYGVGGESQYVRQESRLTFNNSGEALVREVNLQIAQPSELMIRLPSLLGLDVINHWRMDYDPRNNRLEFTV